MITINKYSIPNTKSTVRKYQKTTQETISLSKVHQRCGPDTKDIIHTGQIYNLKHQIQYANAKYQIISHFVKAFFYLCWPIFDQDLPYLITTDWNQV